MVLWSIIGIFSSIFGVWGWLPFLALSGYFIGVQYINFGLSINFVIISLFCEILPALISLPMWRQKSKRDEADDSDIAVHTLTDELDEVSTQSDVIINAIGDGVIAVNGRGIIELINPAAQNLVGWKQSDAISLSYQSVLKLVDEKDDPLKTSQDPIQQSLNSNQQVRVNKLSLVTNSDKKLIISLVASPAGEAGSGAIIVFHDITKETAEEREQAEFISTASHEMRTPVAAIEGYLGLALNPQTATIDERGRNYITKAHESAGHLGQLFQDLLDVSKSEDGRLSNNPEVTNVVTLVNEIVEGLKPTADAKNLRMNYKPMPENSNIKVLTPDYMINLDNSHLREIIGNLIDNAIKYTPNDGEVTIDVTGDNEHVLISVKDNGIGIPAEDVPHLFQKFYRVANKATNNIGGTGLGLYLCRRLAEMMGGRIWVESEYGKGSTFFVELPRISTQDAEILLSQDKLKEKIDQTSVNTPNATSSVPTPDIASPPTPAPSPAPTPTPTQTLPTQETPIVNTVPRGTAMTPEQIAQYVAKQRALFAQQTTVKPQNPPESPKNNV